MKTITVRQTGKPAIPYPNGLTRRQSFNKVLDVLLVCVSGIGITAMLSFLLTVC